MFKQYLIFPILIFSICGCSTTPGDAARRGGHPEQAANLYLKGAEQGDALAAFKLGVLVQDKKVNSKTYGSAGKWYSKGCDLGDSGSCHNAGVGYENGNLGLPKDLAKARSLYLKAAIRGYMQSQYNLGSLYSNQYFNDDIEGLKWLIRAKKVASSCPTVPLCNWIINDPPGHMNNMRSRMSEVQIEKAKKLAESNS